MTPEELEQKRKTYRLIKTSMFAFLPLVIGMLAYTMDPPWMGAGIGGLLAIGELIALRVLKKGLGLEGTPTSSQSQADEKQSEQL